LPPTNVFEKGLVKKRGLLTQLEKLNGTRDGAEWKRKSRTYFEGVSGEHKEKRNAGARAPGNCEV